MKQRKGLAGRLIRGPLTGPSPTRQIGLTAPLPDLDGLSFLDERSAHSHAPFVVISSSTIANTEATREALRHGATACFDKSKLSIDGPKLIKALQLAALQHLRSRLARIEHSLQHGGVI